MTSLAQRIEIIKTVSEAEALLLECNLIKQTEPRYNILLRDDKSFPYIFISKDHAFGQIMKHRGKKLRKGYYFGPFANTSDVYTTIDVLKKSFLLRSCSDNEFKSRTKPCLEYQIKRCSAPCVGLIDRPSYDDLISDAKNFLSGKNAKIQEEMAAQMQIHSQNLEYEKARIIRDRIKALSSVQAKYNLNAIWLENSDVVVLVKENHLACISVSFYRGSYFYGSKFYFLNIEEQDDAEILSSFITQFYSKQEVPQKLILSHSLAEEEKIISEFLSASEIMVARQGEKLNLISEKIEAAKKELKAKLNSKITDEKILEKLKEIFHLENIPSRIEIYDNSHLSGTNRIGAFVVADQNGFVKNGYRKFNIRQSELEKTDDTAMMKQVFSRRFKNGLAETIIPDLIIIDGGKGQLSAVREVFEKLGIAEKLNYIAMSKGENRNAGEETFHLKNGESFTLTKSDPTMFYLQRLRDEAHNYVIGSHRKKRAKSITKSELDEIPGIGKSKKLALLNHFGSVSEIKNASLEKLMMVPGISKDIAGKIKDFLN
jgi:excinuclease ABC subunit C